MSDYIDQSLKDALHWDEKPWTPGMGAINVITESGSKYHIDNDGNITGGDHLPDGGKLNGAVHRQGGPIRLKSVLIGMSMEIIRNNSDKLLNNWIVTTSPVVSVLDG